MNQKPDTFEEWVKTLQIRDREEDARRESPKSEESDGARWLAERIQQIF